MDIATTHPHIFGVDFSGAAQAGRKVWIAGGRDVDGRLVIDCCCRAADLPAGGRERGAAYGALRAFIREHPTAIFGIDAPFGVPYLADVHTCSSWVECVRASCATKGSPAELRARFGKVGLGKEMRRLSDGEVGTPFAPANLWLFRQTFHAIHDILKPLLDCDAIRVSPMQALATNKPVLVEICPALAANWLGAFGKYKERTDESRARRAQILLRLEANGLQALPPSIVASVLDDAEGDALDSVIAAWSVWRVRPWLTKQPNPYSDQYAREGYVYTLKDAPPFTVQAVGAAEAQQQMEQAP